MLCDLLGQPRKIQGIGLVYPILITDYEKFSQYSWILKYSKESVYDCEYETNLEAVIFGEIEDNVIDILYELGYDDNKIIRYKINCIMMVMAMSLKLKDNEIVYDGEKFLIKNNIIIDKNNYDEFRIVVMEQNLIPKKVSYGSETIENLMKEVREVHKRKNGGDNITIEDVISTIRIKTGNSYNMLAQETYYQIMSDFMRIHQISSHEDMVAFACVVGTKGVTIPNLSGGIELIPEEDKGLLKKFGGTLI